MIVAVVMLLVAVGGVWLLLSPGDDDSASDPRRRRPPARRSTRTRARRPSTSPETSASEETSPDPTSAATGDPVDMAAGATATAPRTAPPNVDAFGNRTTYVAANMLDGRPSTCWRMAGDGTGAELRFTLAGRRR